MVHDEWHPDLVLMDLRMPGMGGLEGDPAAAAGRVDGRDRRGHRQRAGRHRARGARRRRRMRSCGSRTGKRELLAVIGERLGVRYVYGASVAGGRLRTATPEWRSALSQRFSGLPPALIEQLREAAIEGRARRLESLADQARAALGGVSAEVRAARPGLPTTTRSCRPWPSRTHDARVSQP